MIIFIQPDIRYNKIRDLFKVKLYVIRSETIKKRKRERERKGVRERKKRERERETDRETLNIY